MILLSGDTTMEEVVAPAQRVWNTWGVHVLVLLSFALQVALLVLAEIRRRKKSAVLRALVWSAYMLADTTAVYTLGHFFVTSRSPEHALMALWAPLLLVHLGGQDNITAYAVEDNRLWLRHLQNLGVQAVAAAYVVYQSSILSHPTRLRAATILIFVVGLLKYGERVRALRRASGISGKGMLSMQKRFPMIIDNFSRDAYHKAQMYLSGRYGEIYSKDILICKKYGIRIRVISLVNTVASFLLFHLDKDGFNSVDVIATYILLVGALVLEIASVLRLIFSTETMFGLSVTGGQWCMSLSSILVSLHQHIISSMQNAGIQPMYWSGSMGQVDLFYSCSRMRHSRRGKILTWMGKRGRWITLDFSWSIPVPAEIIQMLLETSSERLGQDVEMTRFPGFEQEIGSLLHHKLETRVLLWHIATHVYLTSAGGEHPLAKAAEALSNYTMYLLAQHPLLPADPPGNPLGNQQWSMKDVLNHSNLKKAEECRVKLIREFNTSSWVQEHDTAGKLEITSFEGILNAGFMFGAKLINKGVGDDMFEAIALFWMHMLYAVKDNFGEDFHMTQLSNGGEFLSFLVILVNEKIGETISEEPLPV